MKTFTAPFSGFGRIVIVALFLLSHLPFSSFGQISYTYDRVKPDSRKVRKEAKKYTKKHQAEDYSVSHLNMKKYEFRKGEPAQGQMTEEMANDVIYHGVNPVKSERRLFRKKK